MGRASALILDGGSRQVSLRPRPAIVSGLRTTRIGVMIAVSHRGGRAVA
jgi:hypothetical protein